MAEKEKRLEEFFCNKLDRKMTKVNQDHQKEQEQLVRSHEHQIILFEQEF